MEEVSKAKHYIAVNAGGRYPLLKTAQDYTEYLGLSQFLCKHCRAVQNRAKII